MTNEYAVYERRGNNTRSYIGAVEADNMNEAVDIAHDEYGGFIDVEVND